MLDHGQAKPVDETAWLQRFTPRRARSTWSEVNREAAEALGSGETIYPLRQPRKPKAGG